jgi:hypothetical protein
LNAATNREEPDEVTLLMSRLLVCLLSVIGAAALSGMASAADVHVMISAGFHGVYSELAPIFERASGHHLTRGPSMGDSPEADPLPGLIGGGAGDHKGWPAAALSTIAREPSSLISGV